MPIIPPDLPHGLENGTQPKPDISVIIPAKNVERWLVDCINAVRASAGTTTYEIVVVDNGSSDGTLEIASRTADKVIALPKGTISAVRNAGAKDCSGRILAFLDADCLASSDWLVRGSKILLSEPPCVCGYLYDVPANAHWLEYAWYAQRPSGRVETSSLGAGNLWVDRDLFFQIGQFDESLVTGEDTEFCIRAKHLTKVISDDRIRVTHLGNPKSLSGFFKREIWYGLGAFGSFKINALDKPLIGTFAFIIFSMLQLIGFFAGISLFIAGTSGVFALLIVTVVYRRNFLTGPLHSAQLLVLYYLFYLGRAIALGHVVLGSRYDHIRGRSGKASQH